MVKLYPPIVNTSLPAFVGEDLIIPFKLNRAVGQAEVFGISLILKTVTTNKIIDTSDVTLEEIIWSTNVSTAHFKIPKDRVAIGQYYKVQIAFINEAGLIGTYSNAATIKYTSKPEINISLFAGLPIPLVTTLNGSYRQTEDKSEDIYSYCFNIYNEDGSLYDSSDVVIYDHSQDIALGYAELSWEINKSLLPGTIYDFECKCISLNGVEASFRETYTTVEEQESAPAMALFMSNNFDQGCIELYSSVALNYYAADAVIARQVEGSDFWEDICELGSLSLSPEDGIKLLYKDFTGEQGVTYKYCLYHRFEFGDITARRLASQFWSGEILDLYQELCRLEDRYFYETQGLSNAMNDLMYAQESGDADAIAAAEQAVQLAEERCDQAWALVIETKTALENAAGVTIEEKGEYANTAYEALIKNSKTLMADFEDIYLNDGEHCLRIRFNPEISSFKKVIQEAKIETLGSQFPYFFRNGILEYAEFPVAGLISLLMDDQELFAERPSKVSLTRSRTRASEAAADSSSTDLVAENFYNERKFKLEVYDWLNNGKPKVCRTPTEGNYIVKLMNISLSPFGPLGRLLHKFSCTAYEIKQYNQKNLIDMNLLYNKAKEN